jgi:hypothetical protein
VLTTGVGKNRAPRKDGTFDFAHFSQLQTFSFDERWNDLGGKKKSSLRSSIEKLKLTRTQLNTNAPPAVSFKMYDRLCHKDQMLENHQKNTLESDFLSFKFNKMGLIDERKRYM